MKRYAIIVAGGSGQRMGLDVPKQFLPLGQKPVLMHTLEAFYRFDNEIIVLLVLPKSHLALWKKLVTDYHFPFNPLLVEGGDKRFFSVKNALNTIHGDGVVIVHDGVRPLVSMELVKTVFEAAETMEAVVPVLPLTSSIRERLDDGTTKQADRNRFVTVQTPQGFRVQVLKKAYRQPFSEAFTDDASVVEKSGVEIRFIQGERQNIKITTQTDLKLAEFYLVNPKCC